MFVSVFFQFHSQNTNSPASVMNTYTLAVPTASAVEPLQLAITIMETHSKTDRIIVHFGTCSLMCRDEAECEEHGENIRAEYAVEVLLQAAFARFSE